MNPNSRSDTTSKANWMRQTATWRYDALAGFSVFLIALPLCIGISLASGFPATSGILTAVLGAVLVSFIGGTHVAIKGPAAGLIVIAFGAVTDLGEGDMLLGYRCTLAVVIVAGVIQIILGRLKSGVLGDFFPSAVVQGMMAAIGIIVLSRQLHILLGVNPPSGKPLQMIAALPESMRALNPVVAVIGVSSLAIVLGWPRVAKRGLKGIPAPLLALVWSVALGLFFGLGNEGVGMWWGVRAELGPTYLVQLSSDVKDVIVQPDFSKINSLTSLRYILLFALIGSLENMLIVKAVDNQDPQQRRSDQNRDLMGIGAGNVLCGLLGGLPMISEIVRSTANISGGARTSWSNVFHGVFLAGAVLIFPVLLSQIPLAALAAMLVAVGIRLASPRQLFRMRMIGKEQVVIFIVTVIGCLAVDLLVGLAIGLLVKTGIHLFMGLPFHHLLRPLFTVTQDGDVFTVDVIHSSVFSHYLTLRRSLDRLPRGKTVILDFTNAAMVDSHVLHELKHYQEEYGRGGGEFVLTGMDDHSAVSDHDLATRLRR